MACADLLRLHLSLLPSLSHTRTDAAKYQPTKNEAGQLRWKCLDASKELSWSAVNDDYCDCPDGSDEPGTSACPNSSFYCANVGHLPAYIRSSLVDDGICDPECCDGSDERDGKISCPDRCDKVGKEYRKRMTELENIRRAGSKIRDKYIAEGRKEKESLQAEIAKLEIEVQVATENEARLKQELIRAETSDKAVIDAKLKTPLYQKLEQHHQAIKSLKDKNSALRSELQTLTLLLDDLAKGYNPNYQDMAVKGAVVAYKEWRGVSSTGGSGSSNSDNNIGALAGENVKLNQLLDESEWTSERLSSLLAEDPLDIMDGGLPGALFSDKRVSGNDSDGGLLFRIHEYLPDGIVPYFEAMIDTFLDVLLKANVISDVKRMRPKSSSSSSSSMANEPENVSIARRAHTDASNLVSRLSNDLATKKHKLNEYSSRFGRASEFKALENKCFRKDMGEYTYEYCFFGRATQIPNNGGGAPVSLGTFTNFNPANDKSMDEDAYWMQQIYARGQKCWNGPERSAIVDLECGVDNQVLDVFEAEKCIYSIKVVTPAVCFASQSQQEQQRQKKKKEETDKQAAQQQGTHNVKDEL